MLPNQRMLLQPRSCHHLNLIIIDQARLPRAPGSTYIMPVIHPPATFPRDAAEAVLLLLHALPLREDFLGSRVLLWQGCDAAALRDPAKGYSHW